jgi:monofunctional biosynthetic peptidoglycan transglycosylase
MPFSSFRPTYRGRILNDVPSLNTARICQIGFMIADKQEGSFRLEIAWIESRDSL